MTDHPLLFRQPEATRVRKRRVQTGYRAVHRDEINARKRAAYWADPESARQRLRDQRRDPALRPAILAYNREWHVRHRAQLRAEAIIAYGGKCACCGEAESLFLQLDHKDNDGHSERRQHKTTARLLLHLKRCGWPKERHQLLCANCNFGKALNGGVCPHVR